MISARTLVQALHFSSGVAGPIIPPHHSPLMPLPQVRPHAPMPAENQCVASGIRF